MSRVLNNANLKLIAAAFPFLILANFFRACRFKVLSQKPLTSYKLFNIVCVHDFLLNVLPLRTGEFSYLYLMKRNSQMPVAEGLSSLIISRSFDFLIIFLLFLISMPLVLEGKIKFFGQISLYFSIFLVLLIAAIFSILFFRNAFYRLARKIFKKTFIQRKIGEFLASMQILKSAKIILFSTIASLLIWLSAFFAFFFIVQSVGFNLNFLEIIFVFSLPLLLSVLFVQGIAGLGTLEGSWAAGFAVLGIAKGTAIASSFMIHAVILFFLIILAIFGFVNLRK